MLYSQEAAVPIYRRLYDQYKDSILNHRLQPGERVDSITQIQKKHGVARETAKRVLGLLADDGYIVRQPGKGSFVADLGPKQKVWGLVFPFYSLQYEDLIVAVSGVAHAHGRELHHFCDYHSYEEEIRLVGMMLQERYEAVMVIPTRDESHTWEFYSRLSPLDAPVVLFDHTMTSNDFRFVVQTYDLGVTRALDYLTTQKPGSVAFIENEVWPGRNMVLELMRGTYLDYLESKRPDLEPVIQHRAAFVDRQELMAQSVTGIFCCDDASAIQVIGLLKEQGVSVPDDINVVSYGNTDIGRFFTPPITSIDPHRSEMAEALARLLIEPNEGDAAPIRQYVVQPSLIVRGTQIPSRTAQNKNKRIGPIRMISPIRSRMSIHCYQ